MSVAFNKTYPVSEKYSIEIIVQHADIPLPTDEDWSKFVGEMFMKEVAQYLCIPFMAGMKKWLAGEVK